MIIGCKFTYNHLKENQKMQIAERKPGLGEKDDTGEVISSDWLSESGLGRGEERKTLFRRVNTLYICCNYCEKWK